MLNHQQREASPSPTLRDRERPRSLKAQSMPLVPSVTSFSPQQSPQNQPQASPTIPNSGPRRSPPIGQVTRLLPTPPHNDPPSFQSDRRLSPPPGPQQTMSAPNVNQLYARPAPRAPTAAYPSRLQNLENNWEITPELLADIDRADQQQAQYQQQSLGSYLSASRGESPPAKGPNVDRVRAAAERSSPINAEATQQRGRREQQLARESPKNRDRQPSSPILASFAQAQLTPERRMSPAQHSPLIMGSDYGTRYESRESPPVIRRAPNGEQRINPPMTSQLPPSQTTGARAPDRSLPFQEEDEVTAKNGAGAHPNWQSDEQADSQYHSSSPTPSSDLNPDETAQRFENGNSGNRNDDKHSPNREEDRGQYVERDSAEEEGGFTPRSPNVGLPEDSTENYYSAQSLPIRIPVPLPVRPTGRNGATEHMMRGLESTLMEKQQSQQQPVSASSPQQQVQGQTNERSSKYVEQRPPQPGQGDPNQYKKYPLPQDYAYMQEPPRDQNGRYLPPQPQVYPDDFHSYGEESNSAYIQSYSTRPDAPIPPTPQSNTAAPSPSPLTAPYVLGKDFSAYRGPVRTAGSPYPFPFNHVRRNRQNQNSRLIANGLDPATITEQIARQWQVFAQNNQGNITDSTLSPSSTPFQANLYDHWAYLHTNRMMRDMHDAASMHSSPSHQPIDLPVPPHFSAKKKDRGHGNQTKRQAYNRKPPPRVQSTQPRETSPELSSSGEETAGEDRMTRTPDLGGSSEDTAEAVDIPVEIADCTEDSGEWVDEEDEDDYEDLIDLEYHPAFVKNISKRRRKWEVGWENLIQAVCPKSARASPSL